MRKEYVKALARNRDRGYRSMFKTEVEKSCSTMRQLSFLLDEVNYQNEFLTTQIKELLHQNKILKKRDKDKIQFDNNRLSSFHAYQQSKTKATQPYIKRRQFQQQLRKTGTEELYGKTVSKLDTFMKANMDRVQTPSNSIRERSSKFTSDFGRQQADFNNSGSKMNPQFSSLSKQQIIIDKSEPISVVSNTRNNIHLSPNRKGIEVTSKSPSPGSDSKRNKSNSNEKKFPQPLIVQPIKTQVLKPSKSTAIQVTPSLTLPVRTTPSQKHIVSQNIQIKIDSNPYLNPYPQTTKNEPRVLKKEAYFDDITVNALPQTPMRIYPSSVKQSRSHSLRPCERPLKSQQEFDKKSKDNSQFPSRIRDNSQEHLSGNNLPQRKRYLSVMSKQRR